MTHPRQPVAEAVALAEIAAMSTVVLSYMWLWQKTFRGGFLLAAALYFAVGYSSHRIHAESAKTLGLRLDNWTAGVKNAAFVVGVGVFLPLAAGAALGSWHFGPVRGLLLTLLWLMVWGTAQQYGLLCVLYRRFLDVFGNPGWATVASATLFAVFHIPNPFLMGVTFAAGIASCTLYRRVPNVFVLGLGHALISFVLYGALPFRLTHQLRVGPGYFLTH